MFKVWSVKSLKNPAIILSRQITKRKKNFCTQSSCYKTKPSYQLKYQYTAESTTTKNKHEGKK